MNILYVSTRFNGGGAEKVARQLYMSTKEKMGVTTYFLAGRGSKNDEIDCVYECEGILNLVNRAKNIITNNARKRDFRFRKKIISIIKKYKIDIVHFHNIHGNYMGIEDINEIAKYCKVVWTLHDMWAVTGHCAQPCQCNRWLTDSCKKCPNIQLYPKMFIDRAGHIHKVKSKMFTNGNITYVIPSEWLMQKCKQSFLSNEYKILIHNGVDTNLFYPVNKKDLREKYKISEKRTVLMFVSNNLDNLYKGTDILVKALNQIEKKDDYELIIIGNGEKLPLDKTFVCHYMGYINNDKKMNELYSLSDAFILPSRAENFPCTVLESMASGTPVIASRVGGIVEQIDEETGWLFDKENSEQLAQIIDRIYYEKDDLIIKGVKCRKKVEKYFSEDKMIKEYKKLYEDVMD